MSSLFPFWQALRFDKMNKCGHLKVGFVAEHNYVNKFHSQIEIHWGCKGTVVYSTWENPPSHHRV
jgi:hypothetical protein